ncbi:transposase [Nocardia panacis]|uniref:Transposase n=1 Tax=Nocardia panacis TaxID=2340916 RepID=A0A3A4JWM0_9NOCA|nr:transposase [Nocardia panacis]RJO74939.1 transposase [Nocardia panacis]
MGAADLPADDGVAKGSTKKGMGSARPKRRSFTPEYKPAIVAEYDLLTEPGARGALLRREGLYHSHVIEWRRARDAGALDALAAKTTGPKPAKSDAARRAEKLEAENARLRAELERKDKAMAVLGKAVELLEMLSGSADSDIEPSK